MSSTPRPERRLHARLGRMARAGLVALALVAFAGCGGGDDGPAVTELVVPRGTMERLSRGEDVTIMPTTLEFEVGDTLRIRNDDVEAQAVGPYRVAAGDEFEVTFNAEGRFEGICPLADGDRYEIVITG